MSHIFTDRTFICGTYIIVIGNGSFNWWIQNFDECIVYYPFHTETYRGKMASKSKCSNEHFITTLEWNIRLSNQILRHHGEARVCSGLDWQTGIFFLLSDNFFSFPSSFMLIWLYRIGIKICSLDSSTTTNRILITVVTVLLCSLLRFDSGLYCNPVFNNFRNYPL